MHQGGDGNIGAWRSRFQRASHHDCTAIREVAHVADQFGKVHVDCRRWDISNIVNVPAFPTTKDLHGRLMSCEVESKLDGKGASWTDQRRNIKYRSMYLQMQTFPVHVSHQIDAMSSKPRSGTATRSEMVFGRPLGSI